MNHCPPSYRDTRIGLCFLLVFLGAKITFSAHVEAQRIEEGTTPRLIDGQTVTTAPPSQRLDIKIETSRPQPTAGTGLGVIAELKNLSNTTIYLRERDVALTLPPELEGPFVSEQSWFAFFPNTNTDPYNRGSNTIALQPGDAYKSFWTALPYRSQQEESQLSLGRVISNVVNTVLSELNFIFFSPGSYKITTSVKYWMKPELSDENYNTSTQSVIIPVSAPQSVILIGAALGGLIGYFILPHARQILIELPSRTTADTSFLGKIETTLRRLAVEISGIVGSVLLSAIVVILLARLSETQFLIRVTVTDFWGAIAIGFVANYAGSKFLEKILSDTTILERTTLPRESSSRPELPPTQP
jgi:hypothetical protein